MPEITQLTLLSGCFSSKRGRPWRADELIDLGPRSQAACFGITPGKVCLFPLPKGTSCRSVFQGKIFECAAAARQPGDKKGRTQPKNFPTPKGKLAHIEKYFWVGCKGQQAPPHISRCAALHITPMGRTWRHHSRFLINLFSRIGDVSISSCNIVRTRWLLS